MAKKKSTSKKPAKEEPAKDEPAEAAEPEVVERIPQVLIDQHDKVKAAKSEWEDQKEIAKSAKQRWEREKEILDEMYEEEKDGTLFSKGNKDEADAEPEAETEYVEASLDWEQFGDDTFCAIASGSTEENNLQYQIDLTDDGYDISNTTESLLPDGAEKDDLVFETEQAAKDRCEELEAERLDKEETDAPTPEEAVAAAD